jgi:hypothetical protein
VVDFSLFIMVAVLVMLERLEKRPGTAPTGFPLQYLQVQPLFVVSCFSAASSREEPCGFFIYDFLGQDDQSGKDDIRATTVKRDQVAQRGQGLRHQYSFGPRCPTMCSFISCRRSRKIVTPEKSSLRLSSRRSLRRKNTQNKCFLFYKVIT